MRIIGEDMGAYVVLVSKDEMKSTHPKERILIGTILPLCPVLELLPPGHDRAVRDHAYRNVLTILDKFDTAARDNTLSACALLQDVKKRVAGEIDYPTL